MFVLQITRFQIVCGEEEFKRCRLQSFKLLRERSMSLSGHRVSSSGGEEFRRYSSQVFRGRLGRASNCVMCMLVYKDEMSLSVSSLNSL